MATVVEQLDTKIAEFLAPWNVYTTLIAIALAAFVIYPLVFWDEPDTHPLLLARQAQPSPVRQPGESAVYRSSEVPYGYPLKSGLNVKDADTPKWTSGRDGDLRDIWRQFVSASPASTIMTVYGTDAAVEHDISDITKAINAIGKHLQQAGTTKVAIYLPNSIEYLAAIFACAFYGLSPILLPYNQSHDAVFDLLNNSGADSLIASAGSIPLVDLSKSLPNVDHLIWVVEKTSRHMDWDGTPDGATGKLSVSLWHELFEKSQSSGQVELPSNNAETPLGNIVTIWQAKAGGPAKVVEFTQRNIVSAVGALISATPIRQRLSPSDLVLAADTFSNSYVLCLTLASLFQHASLAINSVAGPGVDLALASRGVLPTVIIASPETLLNLRTAELSSVSSGLAKIAHVSQSRALNSGRMPTDNLLFKLVAPRGSAIGGTPGKLRLIFTSERTGTDSPALSTKALSDLRIITRARICYALTAPLVAGAVAQTNMYDYRSDERSEARFGAPLSSVEIKLVDKEDRNVDGSTPTGEIVVSGPAVVGGRASLGVRGTFREDCTLAYA